MCDEGASEGEEGNFICHLSSLQCKQCDRDWDHEGIGRWCGTVYCKLQ